MKLNNAEDYEPLSVYLTPEKTPIAYQNKVECLKLAGHTEEQAKIIALEPIELEIYYEVGIGLFAVESNAADSSIIHSPYTGIELEDDSSKESIIDTVYTLKSQNETNIRNALINLIKLNNSAMVIPRHEGGLFSLCMLDMNYNIFYFQEISFDGKILTFSGTNENNENLNIDEYSLPDNGLLYIYDYLITGSH